MTAADWEHDWVLDRTYRSACGEVRWAVLGAADAPPVVLLHGTPFSSYVWRAFARGLADRWRVFVWDMPGYGASEKSAGQDVSLAAQGRVFSELLDHWGLAGLHPAVWERLVEPWCGEVGQPAFYRQIAQNDQRFIDEVSGRYGEVDVPGPVLVCWGTDDAWISVAHGHELAARIPGARLRLIDGAGHLVQEDAPAELMAAVAGFLAEG